MFPVRNKQRIYGVYAGWVILAALFLSVLAIGRIHNVHAAGSMSLTGYAWSDMPTSAPAGGRGAGWIHFSGSNYTVIEDTASGAISGDAWAETVGWISFNSSDLAGCPSGTCSAQASLTTGAVTGWARALAHDASWDGWIHLSGPTYGVTQDSTTCVWSGYAWGGNILGWIHMSGSGYGVTGASGGCSGVPPTAPTATLSSSNYALTTPGGPVTLTWSSTDTTSCGNITNSNDSSTIATGGATNNPTGVVANVTATTIYTIQCTGPGGSANGVATIVVSSPTISISNFQASPSRVSKGGTSYLLWSTSNFDSCTVKDANNHSVVVPSPSTSSSGTQTPVIVTAAMTYTLTCTGANGSASATAGVNLVPSFKEI